MGLRRWLQAYAPLLGLLALAALVLAAVVRLLWPPLDMSVGLLGGLASALMLLWLAGGGWQRLPGIGRRQASAGGGALVGALAALGIAVLANLLASVTPWRADLTEAQRLTLSPQTQAVLGDLSQPVRLVAFFPQDAAHRTAGDAAWHLLQRYRDGSPLARIERIDPETDPGAARAFNLERYGVIAVEGPAGRRIARTIDELAVTEALMQVSGRAQKTVCWVEGLAGRRLQDRGPHGYARIAAGFQRELWQVRTLDLARGEQLSADCAAILIAGARRDLPGDAAEATRAYLAGGGSLLLLADPDAPAAVRALAEPFGLTIDAQAVSDPSVHVGDDPGTPAVLAGSYPSTQPTRGLETTYFAHVGAVEPSLLSVPPADAGWPVKPLAAPDRVISPLLVTSDKRHAMGAMVLAESAVAGRQTRIIAIADTDFAANAHAFNGSNGDLLVRSLAWLVEPARLIDIRAKPYQYRRLVLSEPDRRVFELTLLALLPCLALLAAMLAWWRGR